MKNLSILLLLSAGILLHGCGTEQNESSRRPNIIVIMADDMGYSDIASYGGEIQNPNLDLLASNGIRFTNFYNAARCCPSRAALLTGKYPHQAGMGGMVSGANEERPEGPYQGYLSQHCMTLAEALKETGYRTYMAGKSRVGERREHWPTRRGFDRYFGLISGASSYFDLNDTFRQRQMALDEDDFFPPENGFYMTDAFTEYAIRFMQEHFTNNESNGKPFFLYLAYTAPHFPLHALPEDIRKYENTYLAGWDVMREQRLDRMKALGILDKDVELSDRFPAVQAWEQTENREEWARKMAVYAAMTDRMDQGIGKVIQLLKDKKQLDNTLIVFLSDNGASNEDVSGRKMHDPSVPIGLPGSYVAYGDGWANASNTPFRKFKKWTNEGGIATPLIVHWPDGMTEKGTISRQVGHVIDLMPTFLEVADATKTVADSLPGMSLMPAIQSPAKTTDRILFWEHQENKGVRYKHWKLVYGTPELEWELYDLHTDPLEEVNLIMEHKPLADSLIKVYNNWAKDIGV